MMEKRITKRDVLNHIIETYANDTMVVDYAKHEIELLDNKLGRKTETKTQKENVELMKVIVETLKSFEEPARINDIVNANENLANMSNQKASALLKKLIDNGEVEKVVVKKVAYFKAI